MDFDDMPDSYFAFLSNQKKLAEPDKINGAMRDLGRGSEPESGKGKVRSRASQPNLSGAGSKPSVPSLPSIQRTSTQPASAISGSGSSPSNPGKTPSKPPSRPQLGSKPPTGPGGSRPPGQMRGSADGISSNSFGFAGQSMTTGSVAPPGKSNALVFVLIAILLGAIGVLAYLVLTK